MVDISLGSGGQSTAAWDELDGGDLPAIIQLARQQVAQLTRALAGRQGPQEHRIARLMSEIARLLDGMEGRKELQEQQMAQLELLMNDLTRLLNELPGDQGQRMLR